MLLPVGISGSLRDKLGDNQPLELLRGSCSDPIASCEQRPFADKAASKLQTQAQWLAEEEVGPGTGQAVLPHFKRQSF